MKVQIQTQLSIVVPNQPGAVAGVYKILSEKKINVGSVMMVDTVSQGVVRFVVERAGEAQKFLEEAGYFVVPAEVAVVDVPNTPGKLFELTKALGDAGVNIDYAYASDNPNPEFIRDTFKLSDLQKGVSVIEKL